MSFFRRNRDEIDDDAEEKEAPSSGSNLSRPFSSSRIDRSPGDASSAPNRGERGAPTNPFQRTNIFDRQSKGDDEEEEDSASARPNRFGGQGAAQRPGGERRSPIGASSPPTGGSAFRRDAEDRDTSGASAFRRRESDQGGTPGRTFGNLSSGSGSPSREQEGRGAPGGDRPRFGSSGGAGSSRPSFGAPRRDEPDSKDARDDASGDSRFSFGRREREDEKKASPSGRRPFGAGRPDEKKDESSSGSRFSFGRRGEDDKKEEAPSGGSRFSLGRRGGEDDKKEEAPSGGSRFSLGRRGGEQEKKDDSSGGSRFSLGRRGDDKKDSPSGRRVSPTSTQQISSPGRKDDAASGSRFSFGRRGGDQDKKDSPSGRRVSPTSTQQISSPGRKDDAAPGGSRFSFGRRGEDDKKEEAPSGGSRFGLGRRGGEQDRKDDKPAAPARAGAPATRTGTFGAARPASPAGATPARPVSRRGADKPSAQRSSRRGGSKPLPSKSSKRVNLVNKGLTLDQKLDLLGLGMLIASVVLFSGLVSSGSFVDPFDSFLAQLFGIGRVVLPVFILIVGVWLLIARFGNDIDIEYLRIAGIIILFLALLATLQWYSLFRNEIPDGGTVEWQAGQQESLITYVSYPSWDDLELASADKWQAGQGGGVVGHTVYITLARQLGDWGVVSIMFLTWIIALMLTAQTTTSDVAEQMRGVRHSMQVRREAKQARKEAKQAEKETAAAPQAAPAAVAAAAGAVAEAASSPTTSTSPTGRPSVTATGTLGVVKPDEQAGVRAPREGELLGGRRITTPEEDKAAAQESAPTRAPAAAAEAEAASETKKPRFGRRLLGGRVQAEKIEGDEGKDRPETADEVAKPGRRSVFGRFGRRAEDAEPVAEGADAKTAPSTEAHESGESAGRFATLRNRMPGQRKPADESAATSEQESKPGRAFGLGRRPDAAGEVIASEKTDAEESGKTSRFGLTALRRKPGESEAEKPAEGYGRGVQPIESAEPADTETTGRRGRLAGRLPFGRSRKPEGETADIAAEETRPAVVQAEQAEEKPVEPVSRLGAFTRGTPTVGKDTPPEEPESARPDLKVAAASIGTVSTQVARDQSARTEIAEETAAEDAPEAVSADDEPKRLGWRRDPGETQVNQATSPFSRARASTDSEAERPAGRFSQLRRAPSEAETPAKADETAEEKSEPTGELFGRRGFRTPRDSGERSAERPGRFSQLRRPQLHEADDETGAAESVKEDSAASEAPSLPSTEPEDAKPAAPTGRFSQFRRASVFDDDDDTQASETAKEDSVTSAASPPTSTEPEDMKPAAPTGRFSQFRRSSLQEPDTTQADEPKAADELFSRVNRPSEDAESDENEKPAVPVGRFSDLLAKREPEADHKPDALESLRISAAETDTPDEPEAAEAEESTETPEPDITTESFDQTADMPEEESDFGLAPIETDAELPPVEAVSIEPDPETDRLREVIRNRGRLDEDNAVIDADAEKPARPRGIVSPPSAAEPFMAARAVESAAEAAAASAAAELAQAASSVLPDARPSETEAEETPAAADIEELPPVQPQARTPSVPTLRQETPAAPAVQPPPTAPQSSSVPAPRAAPEPSARPAAEVRPQRVEWKMPEYMDLLEPGSEQDIDQYFLLEQARLIEDTLASFGAPGKVVEVNSGPVITQFGVEPDYLEKRGGRTRVKVSAIAALDKDIALALAAKSIRIEAPVPGKGFVGIEVPNAEPALVSLRDVMSSDEHQDIVKKSPLTIGLGQSVDGTPISADLTQMPHLLIAGTTGSGKSVCVNAIISCLLLQNTPENLQMIMVDPKRVELTGYNGIPHLISNVVVDLERIIGVLKWVQREMDERYKKLNERGARNIEDYNRRLVDGLQKIPYLVIVIDELADLMMLAPDETERLIARLAQMARATGIHLIISTQRPSVDVVTGLIKANFPARIAFAVASSVDSRVILDAPGADRLLGKGDMLYQAPDASAPVRMQGVFVSDPELDRITRYWKEQAIVAKRGSSATALPRPHEPSQPEAQMPIARSERFSIERPAAPTPPPTPANQQSFWAEVDELAAESRSGNGGSAGDEDDMFDEAVEVVRSLEKASVSLLQRRLRIGYTRAARLIDMMEERGIIGPAESGSKPRRVLADGETQD